MLMRLILPIIILLLSASLSAQTALPDWFCVSGMHRCGVSLPMRGEPEARSDMALAMAVADHALKSLSPDNINTMTQRSDSGSFNRFCEWSSDIEFSYDLIESMTNMIGEEYVMIKIVDGDSCMAEVACSSQQSITEDGIEEVGELLVRLKAGRRSIEFSCRHLKGSKYIYIESLDTSTDEFHNFQDSIGGSSESFDYGGCGFVSPSCGMISCADSMFSAFMNALMWHGPFEITGVKDNNLYFINL